MNEQNVVELEPMLQSRLVARDRSDNQFKKADLKEIMGSETLVLATAVAQAVLNGMERNDRRKERRLLLLLVCALATLIGIARFVAQLLHS